MADVLIRDVPEDVLEAIDAHARRLGLSRSEYVRRQLRQDAQRTTTAATTVADLRQFSQTFADLGDPEAMDQAWR